MALDELRLIRFNSAVRNETRDLDATAHFFESDDRFDEVWKTPKIYLRLQSTLTGIALLPASVIAGLLWNNFGAAWPFLFGAALSLTAAIILFLNRVRA